MVHKVAVLRAIALSSKYEVANEFKNSKKISSGASLQIKQPDTRFSNVLLTNQPRHSDCICSCLTELKFILINWIHLLRLLSRTL